MQIVKANLCASGYTEAPVDAFRPIVGRDSRPRWPALSERSESNGSGRAKLEMSTTCSGRPARTGIYRLIISFVRRARCLRHIFTRAVARINHPQFSQLLPRLQIERFPLALGVGTKWTAAVRPLTPLDSQPSQVLIHGLHELRLAALRIEILVAENQLAALLSSALCGDPKCSRMPEMQQSGWRWREAATIGSQMGFRYQNRYQSKGVLSCCTARSRTTARLCRSDLQHGLCAHVHECDLACCQQRVDGFFHLRPRHEVSQKAF